MNNENIMNNENVINTNINKHIVVTTFTYGSDGAVVVNLDVYHDDSTLIFYTNLINDGQRKRTYTTSTCLKKALNSSKIDQVYELDYSTIKDIGDREFKVALVRKEEDDEF